MSAMIRRGRARFHPTPDDLQLRELQARYHEVAKRVRDDNPRDVALLKVQRRRWFANLERLYGKVAAGRHIAVQQFDRLIADWYAEHPEFAVPRHRHRRR